MCNMLSDNILESHQLNSSFNGFKSYRMGNSVVADATLYNQPLVIGGKND